MLRVSLSVLALLAVAVTASAQTIRNYNVNLTSTAPTIDGVVSPGEWDAAASAANDWRELRQPFTDVDTDNNRFRILYDSTALYILYQTDYDTGWLEPLFGGNPGISFGEENINIYIDPNRDGDLNTNNVGDPIAPGVSTDQNVDGYQFAFNQYLGTFLSTPADRQGIGFFTEAHVNTPFGDQGLWNGVGGSQVQGDALNGSNILVGQVNTNTPSGGQSRGVAEIRIPFADLDAEQTIEAPAPNADYNGDGVQDAADYTVWRDGNSPDSTEAGYDAWDIGYGRGPGAVALTGLNATDGGTRSGPEAGEVWGFNMSQISRDGANFLPIWNWHDAQSFALWPHGTLTFQGALGAVAVPEPTSAVLLAMAMGAVSARRRR